MLGQLLVAAAASRRAPRLRARAPCAFRPNVQGTPARSRAAHATPAHPDRRDSKRRARGRGCRSAPWPAAGPWPTASSAPRAGPCATRRSARSARCRRAAGRALLLLGSETIDRPRSSTHAGGVRPGRCVWSGIGALMASLQNCRSPRPKPSGLRYGGRNPTPPATANAARRRVSPSRCSWRTRSNATADEDRTRR